MADSAVASTGLPYSLSVKTHPSPRSSRDWKDEDRDRDSNSGTPRRRLSMSSSGEFRPQLSAVDFRRDTNSGTSSSPLRARPDESPPSPSAAAASLSKFGVGGCGVGGGVAYQQQQQRSGSGSPRMKHNSSYPSLNNPPSLTTLRMDWQARHGGGGGGGGERNGGGAVCVGGDGSATGQSVGNGDTVDEDRTDSMNQGKGGAKQERLLVVANRLPVCARREADGSWQLDLSAGGLVSALLGVKKNFETVWIGWPGMHVPDEWGRKTLTKALAEKGCVPVFLDEETVDQYYNGYCNNVLWPLFHYIGVTYPMEDKLASTRSLQAQWLAYQFANRQFANVVLNEYREGDTVWCHDYHLMLLPSMLKEKSERMKVGWFLHTPFPSSEIYRTLPLRREILTGVLSSDLIGFHTYDYARHFVSSCSRILGHEGTPDGVENCQTGAITRVAAFPIGIDPDRFVEAVDDEAVKSYIAELRARFAGKKVMLGVDRLDMIKGIPQKLLAFEKFLEEHPDWGDRVILVQIAVPSRTDVPEYQRFSSQVHEIVGRINGRFGTVMNMPIHHLLDMGHGDVDFLGRVVVGSSREGIGDAGAFAGCVANGECEMGKKVEPLSLAWGDVFLGEDGRNDGVVSADGEVLSVEVRAPDCEGVNHDEEFLLVGGVIHLRWKELLACEGDWVFTDWSLGVSGRVLDGGGLNGVVGAMLEQYGSNGEVGGVSGDIEMVSGVGDLEDRGRGDGLLEEVESVLATIVPIEGLVLACEFVERVRILEKVANERAVIVEEGTKLEEGLARGILDEGFDLRGVHMDAFSGDSVAKSDGDRGVVAGGREADFADTGFDDEVASGTNINKGPELHRRFAKGDGDKLELELCGFGTSRRDHGVEAALFVSCLFLDEIREGGREGVGDESRRAGASGKLDRRDSRHRREGGRRSRLRRLGVGRRIVDAKWAIGGGETVTDGRAGRQVVDVGGGLQGTGGQCSGGGGLDCCGGGRRGSRRVGSRRARGLSSKAASVEAVVVFLEVYAFCGCKFMETAGWRGRRRSGGTILAFHPHKVGGLEVLNGELGGVERSVSKSSSEVGGVVLSGVMLWKKAGAERSGRGLVMGVEESIVVKHAREEVSKVHVGFVGERSCTTFVAYLLDARDEREVGNDGGGEVMAEGADVLDEAVGGGDKIVRGSRSGGGRWGGVVGGDCGRGGVGGDYLDGGGGLGCGGGGCGRGDDRDGGGVSLERGDTIGDGCHGGVDGDEGGFEGGQRLEDSCEFRGSGGRSWLIACKFTGNVVDEVGTKIRHVDGRLANGGEAGLDDVAGAEVEAVAADVISAPVAAAVAAASAAARWEALTRSIEFNHLVALYAVTDVALVTSLRDGMNLVSYEFVACQNAKKGVLILSEFAGAAQSLGAGAILVNPWNVSDVASAIEEALTMPEADRVEMHRHNFKHVTLHTAQAWAETFVSELQYTVHEVEMRRKRTPPQLPTQMVVERFADSNNRLLVLGFNATLTRPVEDSGRRGPDQIKEMKPRLHPLSREYLDLLSRDPNTTIVILSGSEKKALDKAFGGLNVWLAAGNGMFLRHARNDKWTAIMPELEGADLRESVQVAHATPLTHPTNLCGRSGKPVLRGDRISHHHSSIVIVLLCFLLGILWKLLKPVFEYFSKRTPGSYLESRETSLIWNYKYADVEFGRVQARDLLQHLLNGSMSSGSFEIVQGTRSIEVRPSGISKGAAMERVLAEIVHRKRMRAPIDFVFVAGKFLNKDEDLYEFFEPRESSSSSSEENECAAHHQPFLKFDSSMSSYINSNEGGIKANRYMEQKDSRKPCLRRCSSMGGSLRQCHSLNCSLTGKYNPLKAGRRSHMKLSPMLKRSLSRDGAMWNSGDPAESLSDGDDQCDGGVALNLRDGTSFSCSVGRSRTLARHMLGSSDDVVGLLKLFAESCGNSPSDDVSVGIQCRQDREGDDSSSWNVGQFPVQLSSVSVNSDMNGNSYSLPHVGSLQCFSTPVGSPVGGSNFGGGVVGTPGHPFGPVRTAPPGSGGKGEPGESPRMQVHLGSGTPGKPGGYQGVPGRGVESPRHHFGGMSSGLSHDSTLHPFGGGVSAPNGDRDSTSPRIHYNSAGVPENLYYSYHPYDNQRDHQFASLHEPTFPYPPNRNGMRSMNGSAMPKPYSVAPRMQATGLVLRREFDALHFPCAQDAGYVPCQEVNYAQDSGNLHAVHPEDNLLLFDSSCPRRWLRYLPRREFGSVPKEVVGVPYEQLTRSTSWG
ncbi:hypothetical protein CBR_g4535 [Chara braunii]|uniref:alpha,alpha-trehalose-phosphate synthase (UDP-forming) n=1 Tax=Chara braunii TaxID=69332 RepID=A0A388KIB3_CHABU|nr:hypothetical protein CBR_g4535 [Chara braunii]|eukprot:GBG69703.1 hypothetical protein CBR_g4535 [Chara braunii]